VAASAKKTTQDNGLANDLSMSSANKSTKKEPSVVSAAKSVTEEHASVAPSTKSTGKESSVASSKKPSLLKKMRSFTSCASRKSTGNESARSGAKSPQEEASVASKSYSQKKEKPVVDSIILQDTCDHESVSSSIKDMSMYSNPSFFKKGPRKLEAVPEELQAELNGLKAQATKISLTCGDGTKEHTAKSFLEGNFADNPNLWKLTFGESAPALLLSELEDLEIHVGGNFFARLRGGTTEGFVEDLKADTVSLCLEERLWLTLSLSGLSAQEMEKMKGASPTEVYVLLTEFAAQDNCTGTFLIDEIQFFCASVPGLMSHVKLSPEQQAARKAELDAHEFLGKIVLLLQEYGNKDSEREVVDKASDILDVFMDIGVDRSDDRLETLIQRMMVAQAEGTKDLTEVAIANIGSVVA